MPELAQVLCSGSLTYCIMLLSALGRDLVVKSAICPTATRYLLGFWRAEGETAVASNIPCHFPDFGLITLYLAAGILINLGEIRKRPGFRGLEPYPILNCTQAQKL